MRNENDYNIRFMRDTRHDNKFDDVCKWKNDSCKDCTDTNPFETQNFCHVAVKLYFADNNIICPQCGSGYLRMTKGHNFRCPNCEYLINFSFIIKKQRKFIKILNRDQIFLLSTKK